jgi:hypothetical protein
MIFPFDYRIREDGVKLIRRLDVKTDSFGVPLMESKTVIDENGNTKIVSEPVPTGFKIRKLGTEDLYDEAIDVENAPYFYEETNVPIEREVEDLGVQQPDISG